MTPVEMEVIIHYYHRSTQWSEDNQNTPSYENAHRVLCSLKLLQLKSNEYVITSKGIFYVKEGLMKVPCPAIKKVFVFPEDK